MRVLIAWGSTRGGTEGLARMLGDGMKAAGVEITLLPCRDVRTLGGYDAVVVGGALYANRWHGEARRFVDRHEKALRRVPVWLFSSGPLDGSAAKRPIPPTREVAVLMDRIGAQGHSTFGGRLTPDARGFPASAMAKRVAGDYRKPERVHAWATEITTALPSARPRPVHLPPGRSLSRLLLHGATGWAGCALAMGAGAAVLPFRTALVAHAVAVPLLFGAVAWHYFRAPGARRPLTAALAFAAVVAVADLALGTWMGNRVAVFRSLIGTWIPFLLLFGTTWVVGEVMSTMPWPDARARAKGDARPPEGLTPHARGA